MNNKCNSSTNTSTEEKQTTFILNIKYTPSKKAKDIIYNKSKEFGECW